MTLFKRAVLVSAVLLLCSALFAQTPGSLKGTVLDPSGAAVPGATITVTGPNNVVKVATSDNNGNYAIAGLPSGQYTMRVIATGFDLFEKVISDIPSGRASTFDVKLSVAAEKQEVTVKDTQSVELDPAKNAGALVLKEADLDMLSDDPDDLQADLLALAGPAAGPNGGQIFIDGFSSGQLPPKDSIREIRINSNPFSAEYDTQGHGRIEIFTKPGSDKYHGSVNLTYSDWIWNARNPFNTQTSGMPASDTKNIMATFSGPLTKKSSFFLDFSRRQQREASLVNVQLLDPNFNFYSTSYGVIAPNTQTRISPRINYQLTPSITLDARYTYNRSTYDNNGIGGRNLPDTAYNQSAINQQFFLTETQVINAATINESRFQFFSNHMNQNGVNPVLNISVGDAFTSGSSFPLMYTNTNNYEFQNYTSITHGTQFIKFGARLREATVGNYNTSNFSGQFDFANITSYQVMEQGIAAGTPLSTIIANGGGPIQYTVAAGQPLLNANQFDAGLFFQDDWKVVPSMTLSLGLRYEIQNNISDHGDWAPRIGWAWGIGGGQGRFRQPKTVIRAGSGFFYDRFSVSNILNAERFNGINNLSYTVQNPAFFPAAGVPIPPLNTLNPASSATFHVDPNLHAPTMLQSAVGIDRQLPHNVTVSLNYLDTRGSHVLRTVNINSPYPGTYVPPVNGGLPGGDYPLGQAAGIYNLYSTSGAYKQNQLVVNANARINSRLSVFGYYAYGHVNTNVNGSPSNPYNFNADWGRASYDIRHQFNINGSYLAPFGIRLSPNVGFRSAPPYNITSGIDLNGDTVVNDRPAFIPAGQNIPACSGRPVVGAPSCTANGFVVNPTPGMTIIPVNYGNAFSQFNFNLRVSKSWGFGESVTSTRQRQQDQGGGGGRGPGFGQAAGGGARPGGGGPGGGGARGGGGPGGGGGMIGGGDSSGKRYTLTVGAMFHNLFNNVNQGIPVGSIISPQFGQAIALASGGFAGGGGNAQAFNRRIDFNVSFRF